MHFFEKKVVEKFAGIKKSSTFALSNENNTVDDNKNGLVAQLNRAFDYGSKGYRFESCRGHKEFARTPFFVVINCSRLFFPLWHGAQKNKLWIRYRKTLSKTESTASLH